MGDPVDAAAVRADVGRAREAADPDDPARFFPWEVRDRLAAVADHCERLLAENERLREQLGDQAMDALVAQTEEFETFAENKRLRARVAELEGAAAGALGQLRHCWHVGSLSTHDKGLVGYAIRRLESVTSGAATG